MDFNGKALRRRDVVMAVLSGGHPDAVAHEYDVSRASVYNWTREYRTQGGKGLVHEKGDRRFSLGQKTPSATMRLVQAILQRDPDYSADKLSAFFDTWGFEISSRTLRNIFTRLGVSTAKQRRKKAFQPDYSDISAEDLDRVINEIGLAEKLAPCGRKPGEVLVQDRVKFPKGFCDEPLAIEIVVDAFLPSKRIYAMLASPCDQLSVDAFVEVERIYKGQGFRIHKVCTPRKQQYAGDLGAVAYPRRFKNPLNSIQEVRPVKAKTADSRIKAAWALLQKGWLKTMPTRLALADRKPKQIEDDLEEWLVAHRRGS